MRSAAPKRLAVSSLIPCFQFIGEASNYSLANHKDRNGLFLSPQIPRDSAKKLPTPWNNEGTF